MSSISLAQASEDINTVSSRCADKDAEPGGEHTADLASCRHLAQRAHGAALRRLVAQHAQLGEFGQYSPQNIVLVFISFIKSLSAKGLNVSNLGKVKIKF